MLTAVNPARDEGDRVSLNGRRFSVYTLRRALEEVFKEIDIGVKSVFKGTARVTRRDDGVVFVGTVLLK